MTRNIHELSDFPYQYVTNDESDSLHIQLEKGKPHFLPTSTQNPSNHPNHPNMDESDIPEDTEEAFKTDIEAMLHGGDEPDNSPNSVHRVESNQRVERYFLAQQGEVWIVWHITDIPESADNPDYAHITYKSLETGNSWGFVANDGMLTMVTAALFLTKIQANQHINESIRLLAEFDDTLQHIYYLNNM